VVVPTRPRTFIWNITLNFRSVEEDDVRSLFNPKKREAEAYRVEWFPAIYDRRHHRCRSLNPSGIFSYVGQPGQTELNPQVASLAFTAVYSNVTGKVINWLSLGGRT
jgi:hypothetical protein